AILPVCFSDLNCFKKGYLGFCQTPAILGASCQFIKPDPVKLLVISAKDCRTCNTHRVESFFRQYFPGLISRTIYYPEKEAKKIVNDFAIAGLPAYLLERSVDQQKNFAKVKNYLQEKGDFYLFNSLSAGISYFQNRPRVEGRVDLFFNFSDPNAVKLLENTLKFNPLIHFLIIKVKDGRFNISQEAEIEANLRAVCAQKYFPQDFRNDLLCQAKNFNLKHKKNCFSKEKEAKISACLASDESRNLLMENISLAKELQVVYSSTYLLENRDIFYVNVIPKEEELENLLKNKKR
ncbi:MAG: hypothetical protein M0Q96_05755, partial [Candidatus Omnitrophica bacterium]|nr:hypothetical protein [Candidatus Omnitrophota bacterium]